MNVHPLRPIYCLLILLLLAARPARAGEATTASQDAASSVTLRPGVETGRVATKELNELSGLAVSRHQPGVLWAHNDSGNEAILFAIDPAGRLLGAYPLAGARNIDWEDIAIGPNLGSASGPEAIYLGDIGDNERKREEIVIYRILEPKIDTEAASRTVTLRQFDTLRLRYPDGAHNAEALMIDPLAQGGPEVVLVDKTMDLSRVANVYHAKLPARAPREPIPLVRLGAVPTGGMVTGGDISADGRRIVIRNYLQAFYWERTAGESLAQALRSAPQVMLLNPEQQGEAIAFTPDGRSFYTASEGIQQPIYRYETPVRKAENSR